MSQKSAIDKQPIIAKAAIHEGDTGRRRNLLAYLQKKDINRYRALIAELGLRK